MNMDQRVGAACDKGDFAEAAVRLSANWAELQETASRWGTLAHNERLLLLRLTCLRTAVDCHTREILVNSSTASGLLTDLGQLIDKTWTPANHQNATAWKALLAANRGQILLWTGEPCEQAFRDAYMRGRASHCPHLWAPLTAYYLSQRLPAQSIMEEFMEAMNVYRYIALNAKIFGSAILHLAEAMLVNLGRRHQEFANAALRMGEGFFHPVPKEPQWNEANPASLIMANQPVDFTQFPVALYRPYS